MFDYKNEQKSNAIKKPSNHMSPLLIIPPTLVTWPRIPNTEPGTE